MQSYSHQLSRGCILAPRSQPALFGSHSDCGSLLVVVSVKVKVNALSQGMCQAPLPITLYFLPKAVGPPPRALALWLLPRVLCTSVYPFFHANPGAVLGLQYHDPPLL